jgi:CheY-like chemotaxis protein
MPKSPIFIVEDDADISRLVRVHLEAADFTTRVLSDGSLVIAEAERVLPKLFILDVMVPGKDRRRSGFVALHLDGWPKTGDAFRVRCFTSQTCRPRTSGVEPPQSPLTLL